MAGTQCAGPANLLISDKLLLSSTDQYAAWHELPIRLLAGLWSIITIGSTTGNKRCSEADCLARRMRNLLHGTEMSTCFSSHSPSLAQPTASEHPVRLVRGLA